MRLAWSALTLPLSPRRGNVVASLLALLLAGCGEKPSASAPSAASAEVRGEPIVPKSVRKAAETNASSIVGRSGTGTAAVDAVAFASVVTAAAPTSAASPDATNSSTSASPSAFAAAGLRITPSGAAPAYSTNPLATVTATPEPPKSEGGAPGYPLVGFDRLAGYTIEISDELLGPVTNELAAAKAKTEALIPDAVKAYTQKHVSLRGFMLPLKVEGGLVTELLVMKDQSMCCYGTVPKIHEWVSVKMTEKGVKPVMDQPVTLFGTLHVGEMRENGYLTGIYRMDGQGMIVPE